MSIRCAAFGITASLLGASLAAQAPVVRNQAWVLVQDGRGVAVEDLAAADFSVKVGGKPCPVTEVLGPRQLTAEAQSWVLLFEPIRDMDRRYLVFQAALDLLVNLPAGDRVWVVARGKDSLESLMPGFSLQRAAWAQAMAKVPGMLPEGLTGIPQEKVLGAGFNPAYQDVADGEAGQEALLGLLKTAQAAGRTWAGGLPDISTVNVLGRLSFDNPMQVRMTLGTIGRDMKALEALLNGLAAVPGQKHVVVFSRNEADDMASPQVKQAANARFARSKGDLGGPAESASLANRDMVLLQSSLKARAIATGTTLYSVAGDGPLNNGNLGGAAEWSGGAAFPIRRGLLEQFSRSLQTHSTRYLVRWKEEGRVDADASLEITPSRKGVKAVVRLSR